MHDAVVGTSPRLNPSYTGLASLVGTHDAVLALVRVLRPD